MLGDWVLLIALLGALEGRVGTDELLPGAVVEEAHTLWEPKTCDAQRSLLDRDHDG